ncbi:sigma-70 family RNA polymerase sigma factor [Parafrankia sp. EUN1f]|uniref:sigma-70 family RNA polymerase sigma factor n=1 Tax=Parafrankia sp. EUN1f TaxID=102897 RepID=UPI0001C455BD|nr:sigma-70 family RNA polymerase sigma factor [Parafrankia sp. EUN1f]EFC84674.1 RNA polymerase, sigma-24 subunit, ECF subfamily [Parafrankia sp. EUN1f]
MTSDSERDITAPAALPRERVFEELVRTHRGPLLSYATRLTGGDRGRAEDVVQETFLRAWHHLERLTTRPGSVHGWLRRVAHNLAVDGHRSRQARPTELELTADHADIAMPSDTSEAVVLSVVMAEALRQVWPVHRSALVEVYLRDRTSEQAAARLGVPVGTVKSRVHYGRRALRQVADQLGLGPAHTAARPTSAHPSARAAARSASTGHHSRRTCGGRRGTPTS